MLGRRSSRRRPAQRADRPRRAHAGAASCRTEFWAGGARNSFARAIPSKLAPRIAARARGTADLRRTRSASCPVNFVRSSISSLLQCSLPLRSAPRRHADPHASNPGPRPGHGRAAAGAPHHRARRARPRAHRRATADYAQQLTFAATPRPLASGTSKWAPSAATATAWSACRSHASPSDAEHLRAVGDPLGDRLRRVGAGDAGSAGRSGGESLRREPGARRSAATHRASSHGRAVALDDGADDMSVIDEPLLDRTRGRRQGIEDASGTVQRCQLVPAPAAGVSIATSTSAPLPKAMAAPSASGVRSRVPSATATARALRRRTAAATTRNWPSP